MRRFHEARPGLTSAALARTGSYERLWSRVHGRRVLDLACGDHPMPGAIGLDLVRERGVTVQGRAQELPFCDGAFDAIVCHLAFMLFDDLEKKESLSDILNLAERGQGVRIFIGSENTLFSLSGSSLIVAPYRDSEDRIIGAVGVIGPTRLNYSRIVPMVDYTAQLMSRLNGQSR